VPQSRLLVPQLDHVASLEKFNSRDLAAPSNTNTEGQAGKIETKFGTFVNLFAMERS